MDYEAKARIFIQAAYEGRKVQYKHRDKSYFDPEPVEVAGHGLNLVLLRKKITNRKESFYHEWTMIIENYEWRFAE